MNVLVCWKWVALDDDERWAGVSAADEAAVKAAVMVEEVARTVHIARQLGDTVPIAQEDIDSLYARYQNVYGQDTNR